MQFPLVYYVLESAAPAEESQVEKETGTIDSLDNFTAFSSIQVSIWRESGSRRPLPRKCQENEGKVLVTLAGAGMTLLGVLLASPPPTVGG